MVQYRYAAITNGFHNTLSSQGHPTAYLPDIATSKLAYQLTMDQGRSRSSHCPIPDDPWTTVSHLFSFQAVQSSSEFALRGPIEVLDHFQHLFHEEKQLILRWRFAARVRKNGGLQAKAQG